MRETNENFKQSQHSILLQMLGNSESPFDILIFKVGKNQNHLISTIKWESDEKVLSIKCDIIFCTYYSCKTNVFKLAYTEEKSLLKNSFNWANVCLQLCWK